MCLKGAKRMEALPYQNIYTTNRYVYTYIYTYVNTCIHIHFFSHIYILTYIYITGRRTNGGTMGWLRLVGSLKS